jgi:hypothetical protein
MDRFNQGSHMAVGVQQVVVEVLTEFQVTKHPGYGRIPSLFLEVEKSRHDRRTLEPVFLSGPAN